jgi:hypothetical protein
MVFLEGTGSLLLDRANEKHIVLYLQELMKNCLLSSVKILTMHQYCLKLSNCKWRTKIDLSHERYDVGETFAVICADCIDDRKNAKWFWTI